MIKPMSSEELVRCRQFSDAWLEAPMGDLLDHIDWQAEQLLKAREWIVILCGKLEDEFGEKTTIVQIAEAYLAATKITI